MAQAPSLFPHGMDDPERPFRGGADPPFTIFFIHVLKKFVPSRKDDPLFSPLGSILPNACTKGSLPIKFLSGVPARGSSGPVFVSRAIFLRKGSFSPEVLAELSHPNSGHPSTLPKMPSFPHAPVAQSDRASDFESAGRRFDSCQARHLF